MEMNWAELNPDVLRHIARRVGDMGNFIRLRAVCKHWRSSVHFSDLPPRPRLIWPRPTEFGGT